MDESWERAVETAFNGQTDIELVRTLTLDGAVKCLNGRLPPPSLFEKFQNLQHLSMANIGVSSLEQFPRLQNLQKLILSDNRIAGGVEFLVQAGLKSLSDLDLSNNRISDINDLKPLAELRLVSLDLYECPVTRVKDYRSRVFGLIKSLKYLDKMDAEENERPESDEEDDEEEEEEEDAVSGEIDGEDHTFPLSNGRRAGNEGVVDVDEDEKSDTDEEETEIARGVNGLNAGESSHPRVNGFKDDIEDEDDLVEEAYEDEKGGYEDAVEINEIEDDDGEDEVEYEEDYEDGDGDEDEEKVEDGERDLEGPESTTRLAEIAGEINVHERWDDGTNEDDDGETGGEEEQTFEEDGDFEDEEEAKDDLEDDVGSGYLVQPIRRVEVDAGTSDIGEDEDEDEDPEMEEYVVDEDEDDDDQDGEVQEFLPPSSHKRKRDSDDNDDDNDDDDDDDDDDNDDGDDGDEDDQVVQYKKSQKRQ